MCSLCCIASFNLILWDLTSELKQHPTMGSVHTRQCKRSSVDHICFLLKPTKYILSEPTKYIFKTSHAHSWDPTYVQSFFFSFILETLTSFILETFTSCWRANQANPRAIKAANQVMGPPCVKLSYFDLESGSCIKNVNNVEVWNLNILIWNLDQVSRMLTKNSGKGFVYI